MNKWVNNVDKYRIVKRICETKHGYRKIKCYTIFEGTEEECIEKRREYINSPFYKYIYENNVRKTHSFYFIEKI